MDEVKETDWANNWKAYFKPFEVGKTLVVKPSWEHYENTQNKKIIEIDPHSSFGTGQHETTKLCLKNLENVVNSGDTALDLGCGSGILSIACILLGAEKVFGVDIEESSIKTSCENIVNNSISKNSFIGLVGNALENKEIKKVLLQTKFNVIVANIVADVILMYSTLFLELLENNGKLLVSGIIESRVDEVEEKLTLSGLTLIDKECLNDWYCLTFILEGEN